MELADFSNKYKSRQPWDFSTNPTKISYIDPDKIHQEAPGKSDIRLHTDLLTFLAYQIDNIVELGVREGESTIAFLMANPKSIISVDINPTPLNNHLKGLKNWKFIQSSSTDPNLDIGEPDLLFIDSDHSYNHVKKELRIHSGKVKKWIVGHDYYSFDGVKQAFDEFIQNNSNWFISYLTHINHGLVICQRSYNL